MLRQPIHFAPGATPIWFPVPSSPTSCRWCVCHGPLSSQARSCLRRSAAAGVNGVVPVEVVIGGRAVPAAILGLERDVGPTHPGILVADDNALTGKAQRPDRRRVHIFDAPFDRGRIIRRTGVIRNSRSPDLRSSAPACWNRSCARQRARRAPRPAERSTVATIMLAAQNDW